MPELARLTGARCRRPDDPSGPLPAPERARRAAAAAQPRASRCCSSPTTSTGPTARRCTCSAGSRARRRRRGCSCVAAYRDRGEEIGPALADTLADLSRLDGVTRLSLGDLSDEEVGAFIRASTDAEAPRGARLGDRRADRRHAAAALRALARPARERRRRGLGRRRASSSRPLAELRGPERIRDVVRQRLSRLAPETAATARARSRRRAAVRAARPRRGCRRRARRARRRASRRRSAAGSSRSCPSPRPPCRFTHELVRRAVYDRITGLRRAELHLRVGEALERVHAADPARRPARARAPLHARRPGRGAERAVDYNLRAGRRSDRGRGLRRGRGETLDRARARDRRPARARARPGRARPTSSTSSGGYAEADAILADEPGRRHRPRGTRPRRARARSSRVTSDCAPIPGSTPSGDKPIAEAAIGTFDAARRLTRPRRRRAACSPWRSSAGPRGRQLRRGSSARSSTRTPPATRRRAAGDRVARATLSATARRRSATAIARCEQLLASYGDDRVLEASDSARSSPLLLAMAGRFDEAREHVRPEQPRPRRAEPATIAWVYRGIAAEAKELIGDRAGAEQELIATWRGSSDARAGGATDERAMNAAYHARPPLLRQRALGRRARLPRLRPGRRRSDSAHPVGRASPRRRGAARGARGRLAEAVALAQRAVELAERSDCLNLRARAWLALAEVQRAAGAAAEADAAVAAGVRLYEAEREHRGSRRCALRGDRYKLESIARYLYCAFATITWPFGAQLHAGDARAEGCDVDSGCRGDDGPVGRG